MLRARCSRSLHALSRQARSASRLAARALSVIPADGSCVVKELNEGNCKTYLVAAGKQAMLVDPLHEKTATYLSFLAYHDLRLSHAVDTHTHADHRTALPALRALTGAKTVMHRRSPAPKIDLHVNEGDALPLGAHSVKVLSTPGHTPDAMALLVPTKPAATVLTGDALLIHGSGRTDFAGGDPGASYDSITRRLFALPDETVVLPGHDYKGNTATTIGEQKVTNERVVGKTKEEYIALMGKLFSTANLPEKIHDVLQLNQTGIGDAEQSLVKFPKLAQLQAVPQVSCVELFTRLQHDAPPPLVVDVRDDEEVRADADAGARIGGSVVVSLRALDKFGKELAAHDPHRPVVVVCRAGVRSQTAASMLQLAGVRNASSLAEGMLGWCERDLPAVKQGS